MSIGGRQSDGVVVADVELVGKEANRWEEQELGLLPAPGGREARHRGSCESGWALLARAPLTGPLRGPFHGPRAPRPRPADRTFATARAPSCKGRPCRQSGQPMCGSALGE